MLTFAHAHGSYHFSLISRAISDGKPVLVPDTNLTEIPNDLSLARHPTVGS